MIGKDKNRTTKTQRAQRKFSSLCALCVFVVFFFRSVLLILGLRLGLRLGLLTLRLLAFYLYLHIGGELLVVAVAHFHLHVNRQSTIDLNIVVGIGVGRKPIFAVYVLAIGLKSRKTLPAFGQSFAVGLDYLQVFIVYPDTACEDSIAALLIFRYHLRLHVEDKCIDLIYLLFSCIF